MKIYSVFTVSVLPLREATILLHTMLLLPLFYLTCGRRERDFSIKLTPMRRHRSELTHSRRWEINTQIVLHLDNVIHNQAVCDQEIKAQILNPLQRVMILSFMWLAFWQRVRPQAGCLCPKVSGSNCGSICDCEKSTSVKYYCLPCDRYGQASKSLRRYSDTEVGWLYPAT